MVDVRTLAAAALGVLLGLLLVVAPDSVVRIHTAGRLPSDRSGEYGTDSAVPDRWRRVVRAVGVVLIAVGLYFGWTLL